MVQLFGPEDAGYLLHLTGKLIGMQYFDEIAARLLAGAAAMRKDFAAFLRALFEAQDDVVEISASGGAFEIRQQSWKLMTDVGDYHPACTKVLEGLFEGLAAGCGRRIAGRSAPDAMRRAAAGLVDRVIRKFPITACGGRSPCDRIAQACPCAAS